MSLWLNQWFVFPWQDSFTFSHCTNGSYNTTFNRHVHIWSLGGGGFDNCLVYFMCTILNLVALAFNTKAQAVCIVVSQCQKQRTAKKQKNQENRKTQNQLWANVLKSSLFILSLEFINRSDGNPSSLRLSMAVLYLTQHWPRPYVEVFSSIKLFIKRGNKITVWKWSLFLMDIYLK